MKTFTHETGEYLEIDGAKIYYELAGDPAAPPLLFLHGGIGTIEEFNELIPAIGPSCRFIGIDSRGHGKSTLGLQPGEPLTYARLQKDVEGILGHLGISTLSIIGFSDGGIVASRLAAANGVNIEQLVTIGAHWQLEEDDRVRTIYNNVTSEGWRKKFPDTYEIYQYLNPEPDFDRLVKSAAQMWLDSTPDGYPGERIRNIACPMLIIRGDDDHLVTLESTAKLRALVKGAKLLNIPAAGHIAFNDQREILLLSLNQFLRNRA